MHNFESLGDPALMALIALGDKTSFALLSRRHMKTMVCVAQRILGNAAEADEVVQESFLRLWINAAKWDPDGPGTVKTWLGRVVTNLCLDRCRARRTIPLDDAGDIIDPAQDVRDRLGDEDRQRVVRQLLDKLPDNQRIAVVLSYFEDQSGKEIAETMGVSVGAVESLLVRARRTLREAVRTYGFVWGEDL